MSTAGIDYLLFRNPVCCIHYTVCLEIRYIFLTTLCTIFFFFSSSSHSSSPYHNGFLGTSHFEPVLNPTYSGFKIALLSLLCVTFPLQLGFIKNLLNAFLIFIIISTVTAATAIIIVITTTKKSLMRPSASKFPCAPFLWHNN
jgi:hypothetical protein